MVEMLMENERVERLRLRQVGEGWVRAITEGALERLERFCQPEVVSHLLTPRRYINFENVTDLVAKYREWFGECSDFNIEQSRVELVGERLGIFYRFLLQKQECWYVIEQQSYCTMQDGRITHLHLLCSGFQPVALGGQVAPTNRQGEAEASPDRDALLVFHADIATGGSTCALLTPAIKSKLREMASGQVLEVRVDDPSAREDIEAWSRLSGNSLLRMNEAEGTELQFFVMKK
jgi:tRNA 2-thiouridine synthesizing protein A